MDYIDIISGNVKPEELLHEVAQRIKKEHTAIVRACSSDKINTVAGLLGEMSVDVDLLVKIDEKMNGTKKTSVIA